VRKAIVAYNQKMQQMAQAGQITIGKTVFNEIGLFGQYFKYYANSTLKIVGKKGFPLAKIGAHIYIVLQVWEKVYGKIRTTEDLVSADKWFAEAMGWNIEEAKKDKKAWKLVREFFMCESAKDDEKLRQAWEEGWRPGKIDENTGRQVLPREELQTEAFKNKLAKDLEMEANFNKMSKEQEEITRKAEEALKQQQIAQGTYVDRTPKEGEVIELDPTTKGGPVRKMVYTKEGWRQTFGEKNVWVNDYTQSAAQEAWEKKKGIKTEAEEAAEIYGDE
jgi:hypothetical protein